MNLKWEQLSETMWQTQTKTRHFQISKAGKVWELVEVLERLHSDNHMYAYLSNTKSLTTAKSLIKKFNEGAIYFDEKCRPKEKA